MNVAFFTDSFPPIMDGVSRCVVECAKAYTEGGHGKSIVVTPYKQGADDSVYPFPVFRFTSVGLPNMDYRFGYPYFPELIKKLKEFKIGIIHAHSPFMAMSMSRQLRRILDIPIVYTNHTKWEFDIAHAVKSPLVVKIFEKFIYKNINSANDVWAVSHKTGEHIKNHGFRGRYTVMENGTDFPKADANENFIEDINKKFAFDDNTLMLLFVGRMMWYKNQQLIFDAVEILKKINFNCKMIFVGDGSDLDDMKQVVHEKNLQDYILFAGRVNDRELLRAYYTRSDLFVFPSTYDNAPLVIREAAACGCPSLVIRESSAAEILEESGENQSAFFAEESPESIAANILNAFENKKIYELVKKNAAEKVYLPWSKVMCNSVARYNEVCERYKNKNKK